MQIKNKQHKKLILSLVSAGLLAATTSIQALTLVPIDTEVNVTEVDLPLENVDPVSEITETVITPAEEMLELQRRQSELLVKSDELSALRFQYAHAQLWFLYTDTVYLYWSYDLQQRLVQLEQVNFEAISAAIQSLVNLANNSPGTDPCNYFGGNNLVCSISIIQNNSNWLQNRSQQIFASAGASAWYEDWKNRWQQSMEMTEGYVELKQGMDQFLEDYPELTDYFQLIQDLNIKSSEIMGDSNLTSQVNNLTQQYSSKLQAILDTTDYNLQLGLFNDQSKELLETDPDYVLLQQEGERVINSLENLMQRIHSDITMCLNWGYGNNCFDPQFNYFLQESLPSYSAEANQALINSAQATEQYYQFSYDFSQKSEVKNLQNEFSDSLQATLEPVMTELEDTKEAYIDSFFSFEVIFEKLGSLLDRITELGEKLGFVQS